MALTVTANDPDHLHYAEWWHGLRSEGFVDHHVGERVGEVAWFVQYDRLTRTAYEVALEAASVAMGERVRGFAQRDRRSRELVLYRYAAMIATAFVSRFVIVANAIQTFDLGFAGRGPLVVPPASPANRLHAALRSHRSRSSEFLARLAIEALTEDGSVLPTSVLHDGAVRVGGTSRAAAVRRAFDVHRAERDLGRRLAWVARRRPSIVSLLSGRHRSVLRGQVLDGHDVVDLPRFGDVVIRLGAPAHRPVAPTVRVASVEDAVRFAAATLLPTELLRLGDGRVLERIEHGVEPWLPRTIIAAYLRDVISSSYVAAAVSRGARLVLLQHGGNYGMQRGHLLSEIEPNIADRFGAWGWAAWSTALGAFDLPMQRSHVALQHLARVPDRRVHVPGGARRVLYVFSDHETGDDGRPGLERGPTAQEFAAEFLRTIDPETLAGVRLRRRPASKGRSDVELWMPGGVDVAASPPGRPLVEDLAETDVVVVDTPTSTVCLESLGAGLPTLMIAPGWRTAVRREAHEVVEGLERVGVIVQDGRAAAQSVTAAVRDPRWWDAPERRRAVDAFRACAMGAAARPSALGDVLADSLRGPRDAPPEPAR